MSIRKHKFVIGEYYHIYNRGTDKRKIILGQHDLDRFLESMKEFNVLEPIGSIYEFSFQKDQLGCPAPKLVSFVAFCVNPNHFHFLITPLVEKGIEKFMQKIGGYPKYFNEKYKRNGVLFQGRFKSKHISDNKYLLHLSAYINMNNRDKCGNVIFKFSKSSLEEYIKKEKGDKNNMCDTKIISEQFKNKNDYLNFSLESWCDTLARKKALEFD
jgi:REP element-mobilizing transposase RayT